MKRLFWLTAIAAALIPTSCEKNNGGKGSDTGIFSAASGEYLGDVEGNGTGAFSLALSDSEISLTLVFYSDLAADPQNAAPADGDYNAGENKTAFTFLQGSINDEVYAGSFFTSAAGEKVAVTDGSFSIDKNGDQYTVITNLEDGDGKMLDYKYTGPISFIRFDAHFDKFSGYYWGPDTWDFPDLGEYSMTFRVGETGQYGDLVGEGYSLNLYAYDVIPEYAPGAMLSTGTYTVLEDAYEVHSLLVSKKKYSIFSSTSLMRIEADLSEKYYLADSGTMTLSESPNGYEVIFDFIFQEVDRKYGLYDEDTVYGDLFHFTFKYEGNLYFSDQWTWTTLREDVNITSFVAGQMTFNGHPQITWDTQDETLYDFTLLLLGEGITVNPNTGNLGGKGAVFQVELTTDLNYTTELPSREFPVSDEYAAFNTMCGTWIPYLGMEERTWYFYVDFDNGGEITTCAPALTGSTKVTKNGASYIFEMDYVDDIRNSLKGRYEGPVQYFDESGADPAPAPVIGKTVEGLKHKVRESAREARETRRNEVLRIRR